MTSIRRTTLGAALAVALVMPVWSIAPAAASDRSDAHALALSYRYGSYTKPGNIAAGETVVIDTPEGSITCSGGSNREDTGANGPEGKVKRKRGGRVCHFN